MERMLWNEVAQNLLTTQYRMHDVIKEYSNQYFYHGKLTTAPAVQADRNDAAPLVFIDTAGCGFEEAIEVLSSSTYNQGEIDTIDKWLTQAYELGFLKGYEKIGIISPYSAQVKRLKEGINTAHFSDVKISTVDSFQGQEADVIIISLVRSNDKGEIGFLNDTRRMNVAMTRAKHKLVMVGDSATISNSTFYKNLLDYLEANGQYHSAWEWM